MIGNGISFVMTVYFVRGTTFFMLKQKFIKIEKTTEELHKTTLIELVIDMEDRFKLTTDVVQNPQLQQTNLTALNRLGT